MSSPRIYATSGFALIAVAIHLLSLAFNPLVVKGLVEDEHGPVSNASVGWQGDSRRVSTDRAGCFQLPNSPKASRLIATKPRYRIASASSLTLRLTPLPEEDNDDYRWIDPHPDPFQPNNCANCHAEIYREWAGSAHAHSATNRKFLSLFAGTDGKSPIQKTWNARAEHPDGSAVCASCHVPTLKSATLEYDVRDAQGVSKSGIHCDYCHKVNDVPPGKFGTRFGRDALELLRPAPGDALTFGPLDDAVRPGETFAHRSVYKESRYCASCHEGIVFGVHAYGTYSEWLESPSRTQGKQCQDCHMAPTGKMTNIAPKNGGIERAPHTLASHHTPGGQPEMLRSSLRMALDKRGPSFEVEITAQNVGHRVPTGFPDRHLILVVTATDAAGQPVKLLEGPRLPKSAGPRAGRPGSLFAKQFVDEHGRTPMPFWLPIEKTEDTRLFPDRPERRAFRFPVTAARMTAQLWYRRFWHEVADARNWRDNDFLVVEKFVE